jgi:hypothetical protein
MKGPAIDLKVLIFRRGIGSHREFLPEPPAFLSTPPPSHCRTAVDEIQTPAGLPCSVSSKRHILRLCDAVFHLPVGDEFVVPFLPGMPCRHSKVIALCQHRPKRACWAMPISTRLTCWLRPSVTRSRGRCFRERGHPGARLSPCAVLFISFTFLFSSRDANSIQLAAYSFLFKRLGHLSKKFVTRNYHELRLSPDITPLTLPLPTPPKIFIVKGFASNFLRGLS